MATTEFKIPGLGENVDKGDVINVLVAVGETIAKDQPVLELETGKAVVEVPSSVAGTVKEIKVSKGETVKVDQIAMIVDTDGGGGGEAKPPAEAKPQEKPAEAPAEKAVQKPAAPARETREPVRARGGNGGVKIVPPAPAISRGDGNITLVPAAPSVRRFARELGLDISKIPGSGRKGRISLDDVKEYSRELNAGKLTAAPAGGMGAVQPRPLPDFTQFGDVERERMSSVRRMTAHHMSQTWNTVPQVTHYDKADITDLEAFREKFQKRADKAGAKLTVTAIMLKVISQALKAFPKLNASVDLANEEVVYKNYFHIGVAVDTPQGLLVPVIRDVDRKSIIDLAKELGDVAQRARDRKLGQDDLAGGCFSISNLGGIGGVGFSPIVNWPEVAILGMSRSSVEPVWKDGHFVPRTMLPLSLSYDHRLVDGADAARFLRWVCEALETPMLLMFDAS